LRLPADIRLEHQPCRICKCVHTVLYDCGNFSRERSAIIKRHKEYIKKLKELSEKQLLELMLMDVDWMVNIEIDFQIRLGKTRRATATFFLPKTLAIFRLFEVLNSMEAVNSTVRIQNWYHNTTNTHCKTMKYKWTLKHIDLVHRVFPNKFIQRNYPDEHGVVNFDFRKGPLCGGVLTPTADLFNPCIVTYDWDRQKVAVQFYFVKSKCVDVDGKAKFRDLLI